MAAFIDQTVRSLMRGKDGHELFILFVSFTEVGTESTLSVMNCRHNDLLGQLRLCAKYDAENLLAQEKVDVSCLK
jgi:hypothetical protein